MQQSAVHWLSEQIIINRITDYNQLVEMLNKAARWEKDQIIEAYESPREFEDGEEYFYQNYLP